MSQKLLPHLQQNPKQLWALGITTAAILHVAVVGAVWFIKPKNKQIMPEPVMTVQLELQAQSSSPTQQQLPSKPPQAMERPPKPEPMTPPKPIEPKPVKPVKPKPPKPSSIERSKFKPNPLGRQTPPPKPVLEQPVVKATPVTPQPMQPMQQPIEAPTLPASKTEQPSKTEQGADTETEQNTPTPASSKKAKKAAQSYFSMISAHLNRNKSYPAAAKKSEITGVVTVRFTVEPDGSVSSAAIKTSSGFALLDEETLKLLRRVGPFPPMPKDMVQEAVTVSQPINYQLETR